MKFVLRTESSLCSKSNGPSQRRLKSVTGNKLLKPIPPIVQRIMKWPNKISIRPRSNFLRRNKSLRKLRSLAIRWQPTSRVKNTMKHYCRLLLPNRMLKIPKHSLTYPKSRALTLEIGKPELWMIRISAYNLTISWEVLDKGTQIHKLNIKIWAIVTIIGLNYAATESVDYEYDKSWI